MNNYVCNLSIRRNIAPPTTWHWCVEMPNGHVYANCSTTFDSLAAVLADAATNGAAAMIRAESCQASQDPRFARLIGWHTSATSPELSQPTATTP